MTDTVDKRKRSSIMKSVGTKHTKPELLVRRYLFSQGFRFKLHDKKLPGTPDIILPKYKSVIFVNGCFWHGHNNCRKATIPKSNSMFWIAKLDRNKERDNKNISELENQGWNVLVIWDCELLTNKRSSFLDKLVQNLKEQCL